MGALTPSFVVDFETRMQTITEREYARLASSLWWQQITKVKPSTGRKEIMAWLLSTAMIKDQGDGGNIAFDDLVAESTEIENKHSGAGLRLRRDQLEDTYNGIAGGFGLDLGAHWASDIGAYMAYWPQKQVTDILKNGHTASLYTAYTTKAFFATDHPLNPFNIGAGTYKNLFTGGDAADISAAVTPDVAVTNLGKVYSLISGIKMPNGVDPRFLRPKALIVPPKLYPRAVQITDAKFLAMAASSGGGSADVTGLIQAMGFAKPIQADELNGFEDDTTYFVAAEQISSSELGAVVYVEREPYKINYYGQMTDAELNRMNILEWHCRGRNAIAPGHPYLLFKVKAS